MGGPLHLAPTSGVRAADRVGWSRGRPGAWLMRLAASMAEIPRVASRLLLRASDGAQSGPVRRLARMRLWRCPEGDERYTVLAAPRWSVNLMAGERLVGQAQRMKPALSMQPSGTRLESVLSLKNSAAAARVLLGAEHYIAYERELLRLRGSRSGQLPQRTRWLKRS